MLDSGGMSAVLPTDERGRARLRALRRRADDLLVPAAVLAEGVFTGHVGRDHHMHRLLDAVDIVAVDRLIGLAAGGLRSATLASGVDPPPSGVDAIVAAVADARAAHDAVVVLTSDASDLRALVDAGEHAARVAIRRV